MIDRQVFKTEEETEDTAKLMDAAVVPAVLASSVTRGFEEVSHGSCARQIPRT